MLHDAGLVTERREGTRRLYQLRREGLDEVTRFIESFWDRSLSRLQLEAERQERARRAEDLGAEELRTEETT